uniref:Uncharacterized protein n=1 Tax=Arundo donax TaxID=35708 RepID=A0A0A9TLW7_ARUDO
MLTPAQNQKLGVTHELALM